MRQFKFEHEKFKKYYGKLCPCLVPTKKTATQENMCPCKEFIENANCRCMLFVEENV